MHFSYRGGSERGVDNIVYKYIIDGKAYSIINKMKRINQDMGLCTWWWYVIIHFMCNVVYEC